MSDKETKIMQHPHFEGLAIEGFRRVKGDKEFITYRFCRVVNGFEKPFTDLSDWQIEALIEFWYVQRYKARNAENKEHFEATGERKKSSVRVPLVRASEALPSSLKNVAPPIRFPEETEPRGEPLSFEDDDLPF